MSLGLRREILRDNIWGNIWFSKHPVFSNAKTSMEKSTESVSSIILRRGMDLGSKETRAVIIQQTPFKLINQVFDRECPLLHWFHKVHFNLNFFHKLHCNLNFQVQLNFCLM